MSSKKDKPVRRKPDNVADNPMGMAYGTNISAPSITLPDVTGFKKGVAAEASHRFHQRATEIKEQYDELIEQSMYNDRLLKADVRFRPSIGEVYHLYETEEGDFISMISPEEWGESYMKNKTHVGSFLLKSDNVWEKV